MPKADTAPDPDMAKAWTNKAHGNTLYAHIADIKTAWHAAPLTLKERRAVFMRLVLDDTQKYIASVEGCSQPTVSVRLYTAIGKLVATLNGGEFVEGDLPE